MPDHSNAHYELVVPRTEGPSTGSANPRCYARHLADCSLKMSAEHFKSSVILEKIRKDKRGVFITGVSWAPDGKWVPPRRLASKVLCLRHNRSMSPLDKLAGALHSDLARITAACRTQAGVGTVVVYNGDNVERWLMKTLCGLIASGQARNSTGDPVSSQVHSWWVDFLFGHSNLVTPLGMYVDGRVGSLSKPASGRMAIAPISANGQVVGLDLEMQLLHCRLILQCFTEARGAIDSSSIRRPSYISWAHGSAEHRVNFRWSSGAGPGVQCTWGAG
jgi:hypothetical protein